MHTTPNRTNLDTQIREAKAELELVAIRVQAKALKTLEALMDQPEPTGDAKQDAIIARERNRRRLAATQALTHTRALERQQRAAAKAREKRKKQATPSQEVSSDVPPAPPEVPLAACPPVPGLESQSDKPDAAPPTPEPDPIDYQQAWRRERQQAMVKARAKLKQRRG
ncbi:MAG: hypothetical protein NXI14_06605 [bacterium]|nr:hypothetical protein [bacterium]